MLEPALRCGWRLRDSLDLAAGRAEFRERPALPGEPVRRRARAGGDASLERRRGAEQPEDLASVAGRLPWPGEPSESGGASLAQRDDGEEGGDGEGDRGVQAADRESDEIDQGNAEVGEADGEQGRAVHEDDRGAEGASAESDGGRAWTQGGHKREGDGDYEAHGVAGGKGACRGGAPGEVGDRDTS